MKLVMTLQVRNEEDILKENIDYHLNQGVDFIIATDNRSTDATKDILKSYEKAGVLLYQYEPRDTHDQGTWVTQMARMASQQFAADWIINNDADEFWWPSQHATLKQSFSSLDSDCNVVEAGRNNFVYLKRNEDKRFYHDMIYKEQQSLNTAGRPLPPKQAHRGNPLITVSDGNHSVEGFEKKKINKNLVEILHFPIRSKKQLTNKIHYGGAALERNDTISDNTGSTWRKLYQQYLIDGNLDTFLSSQHHDHNKLVKKIADDAIVIDERLKLLLKSIYNED